MKQLLLMTI